MTDQAYLEEAVEACLEGAKIIKEQDAKAAEERVVLPLKTELLAGGMTYGNADGERAITELIDDVANDPINAKCDAFGMLAYPWEEGVLAVRGSDYSTPSVVAESIIDDLQGDVDRDPVNEKYRIGESYVADAVTDSQEDNGTGAMVYPWEQGELVGSAYCRTPSSAADSILDTLRDEVDSAPCNAKYRQISSEEQDRLAVQEVVDGINALADPLNTDLLASGYEQDSTGLSPDLRSELALMSIFNDVEAAYPGQKTPEPQDVQLKRAA
jgi:hypothetical protein